MQAGKEDVVRIQNLFIMIPQLTRNLKSKATNKHEQNPIKSRKITRSKYSTFNWIQRNFRELKKTLLPVNCSDLEIFVHSFLLQTVSKPPSFSTALNDNKWFLVFSLFQALILICLIWPFSTWKSLVVSRI